MIYVTRSFTDDVGKVFHEIQIHTSCCKDRFLILEETSGKYVNLTTGEPVLDGMAASIKQQIEFQKRL